MAGKYTHEQAVEAAERMHSMYGFYVGVNDYKSRPEDTWEEYSFIGIHPDENGPCVFVADEEGDIEALRKMAYLITQIDQDLSQEDPNLDPTYANRMLMGINQDMVHGEVVQHDPTIAENIKDTPTHADLPGNILSEQALNEGRRV